MVVKLFASCLGASLLSLNFFGNGKDIVPDSFRCFDGCNTCYFKIRKIGSFKKIIGEGCTETFCFREIPEAELEEFQKCSSNWLFSRSIDYDRLSNFANNCVNGYRNLTYVERKQEKNPDFTLADLQIEHTREALTKSIASCNKLESFLQSETNFSQEQIDDFGVYLRSRRFTNPYNYVGTIGGMLEAIQNQKLIFDYLKGNPHSFSDLITFKMMNEFFISYAGYLNDRAKYNEETFEQRRNRLYDSMQK